MLFNDRGFTVGDLLITLIILIFGFFLIAKLGGKDERKSMVDLTTIISIPAEDNIKIN